MLKNEDLKDKSVVVISLANQSSKTADDLKYNYELPEGVEIISNNCSNSLSGNSSCSLVFKYDSEQQLEDIKLRVVYENDRSLELRVPTDDDVEINNQNDN